MSFWFYTVRAVLVFQSSRDAGYDCSVVTDIDQSAAVAHEHELDGKRWHRLRTKTTQTHNSSVPHEHVAGLPTSAVEVTVKDEVQNKRKFRWCMCLCLCCE